MTSPRTMPANLDSIRKIKAECQAAKLHWPAGPDMPKARRALVDFFTASAVVAVADAVNDDNRAKIERMIAHSPERLRRVASFAYQNTR